MIARYNNISLALGIPGLILQIAANVIRVSSENQYLAVLAWVAGTALLVGGFVMYAKSKGRSPAWGLMGFLSIIGLIVLAMLEDRTLKPKPSIY
jgi:hypothetical protein